MSMSDTKKDLILIFSASTGGGHNAAAYSLRSGLIKKGYDASLVPLVLERLDQHGYLDDRKFAQFWLENHHAKKGSSIKKLRQELFKKGVSAQLIDELLTESSRNDQDELRIIIAKKSARYPDRQKFIQYLVRQGFNYSDVLDALSSESSSAGE